MSRTALARGVARAFPELRPVVASIGAVFAPTAFAQQTAPTHRPSHAEVVEAAACEQLTHLYNRLSRLTTLAKQEEHT